MATLVPRPETGLIIGKFLPPHRGHQFLIDFARRHCRRLTVLVCSLAREPIPGALRWQWVREMFPDVDVLHHPDENPQEPFEHPYFWKIWHDSIRRYCPRVDCLYASESYGFPLAEVLGASYIPVDQSRELVPVSGTAVRSRPLHYWAYIPEPVRPYFVRRVRIIGPESSGKTVLARRLANRFQTVQVSEYARGWIDLHDNLCREQDFERYVQGQVAAEEALARQANRVLICDTDPLTTQLWAHVLFGRCPPWIEAEARSRSYSLTLLTTPDVPWVDDGQRYQPDLASRRVFFDECRKALEAGRQRYVILQGNWEQRFEDACAAVNRLLAEGGCLPDESQP